MAKLQHPLRVGAMVGFLLPAPALGHEPPPDNFDGLTERAEAIVRSRVARVEYALSQAGGPTEPALPFTYVTLEIQEVLKGRSVDGGTLTLRFLGGPFGDGRFLRVLGAPMFDVGDADLLFVAGNGASVCPLVSCGGGRFRMIDGRVYDEDGFELKVNPAGKVVYGSRRRLPAIDENTVGNARLRRVDRVEADSAEPGSTPGAAPAASGIISAQHFNGMVKERVRQRISPERLASLPPVASARAQERFVFRGLRPGGPARESADPRRRMEPRTEVERQELEAIDRNYGNPVLPVAAGRP